MAQQAGAGGPAAGPLDVEPGSGSWNQDSDEASSRRRLVHPSHIGATEGGPGAGPLDVKPRAQASRHQESDMAISLRRLVHHSGAPGKAWR